MISIRFTILVQKSVHGNFFLEEMKDGDASALFKNSDSFHKKNYRPITVLPSVSKVFERLLANQMLPFVNKFLSPKICGYRQGYNTLHALLKLVDTCKKALDNKGFVGAVLMYLSKAFDYLNHDLLLAKLNAYGFSANAIQMMHSYHISRVPASGYKFRFTFRSLSDVSYSDECRTKISFSVWLKHDTAFLC